MNTCCVTKKDMFTFSRGTWWRKGAPGLLLPCSFFSQCSRFLPEVCVCVTGSHFPPISSKFSATAFWRKLKVSRKAWREGEGILHNADVHVTPLTVTGCGGLSCVLLWVLVREETQNSSHCSGHSFVLEGCWVWKWHIYAHLSFLTPAAADWTLPPPTTPHRTSLWPLVPPLSGERVSTIYQHMALHQVSQTGAAVQLTRSLNPAWGATKQPPTPCAR